MRIDIDFVSKTKEIEEKQIVRKTTINTGFGSRHLHKYAYKTRGYEDRGVTGLNHLETTLYLREAQKIPLFHPSLPIPLLSILSNDDLFNSSRWRFFAVFQMSHFESFSVPSPSILRHFPIPKPHKFSD